MPYGQVSSIQILVLMLRYNATSKGNIIYKETNQTGLHNNFINSAYAMQNLPEPHGQISRLHAPKHKCKINHLIETKRSYFSETLLADVTNLLNCNHMKKNFLRIFFTMYKPDSPPALSK